VARYVLPATRYLDGREGGRTGQASNEATAYYAESNSTGRGAYSADRVS